MTSPTQDPATTARELVALTILKDAVAAAIEDRRRLVEQWEHGTKLTVTMPNAEVPAKPHRVGEVRLDGGQTVAVVADRAAWQAWVQAESPHNIGHTVEGRTAWRLDEDSRAALTDTYVDVLSSEDHDPWSSSPAERFLRALEDRGYTITPVVVTPAETFVREAYEQQVLKFSQEAGQPVTPDGEIPLGVEVTSNTTGRPYVKVEKDQQVRASWLETARSTLPALLPGLVPDAD